MTTRPPKKTTLSTSPMDTALPSDRRDFLTTTATVAGCMGAACMVWPFLQSMGPAADTEAMATIDVDVSKLEPGQALTVLWRGKPVFIRKRTLEEIEAAKKVPLSQLIDPQSDEERFGAKPEWLVVIGVCTHLGCVPQGQKVGEPRGEFGGWFCPCHGSEYDISGRVRKGPAPQNLPIPDHRFVDEKTIRIGEKGEHK